MTKEQIGAIDNTRWDGKENWIPQSAEALKIRNLLRDVAANRITIAEACSAITDNEPAESEWPPCAPGCGCKK